MKPCVTADSLKVLLRGRGLMRVVDGAVVRPVGAVGAVPGVVAVDPGQLAGEGREEVEQGPGDDHVVVEAHVQRDQDHRVAHACTQTLLCFSSLSFMGANLCHNVKDF